MSQVVTRFAPSPTGFMHVGALRTALFAWLFARKNGGRFILRIEDTDKAREVAGSIDHIIESLTWLGIEWDEGVDKGGPHAPYLQSERLDSYRTYAKKLIEAGHAYTDPYTKEEVDAFRKTAEAEHRPFLYRDHRPSASEVWDGSKPLRFRAPRFVRYTWEDVVRGTLSAGEEAIDDFILIKSDGYPTYNFAHIVDDIEMAITHVIRGQEFISSMPNYLSLYEALGVTPPIFATMPPILNEEGNKKLGKRDGAKDILEYRAEGYLPEAMLNFLALLGWNTGTEQEFFSKQELIEAFELSRVQPSGAQFDETKLLSVNHHWMRQLSVDYYLASLDLGGPTSDVGPPRSHMGEVMLRKVVPLLQERAKTFGAAREMLAGELSCFFTAPTPAKETLLAKEPADHQGLTKAALEGVLGLILSLSEGCDSEAVKAAVMPFADAEEAKGKGGRGGVLWPLRYALSGQERSPDPFTLVSILGATESAARIRTAIAILG